MSSYHHRTQKVNMLLSTVGVLLATLVFICDSRPHEDSKYSDVLTELNDADLDQLARAYLKHGHLGQSHHHVRDWDRLQGHALNNINMYNVARPADLLAGSWHGASTCTRCKLIFWVVQHAFVAHRSEAEIVTLLTELCIELDIEDEVVCTSIVPQFKTEFLTVIDQVLLKPSQACSILYGKSCGSTYNPALDMWNITLPDVPKPPVVPPTSPPQDAPKIRILHISDVHVDLQYKPGSNAECGEPLCCRADSPGPTKGDPAGYWGDYRSCDTPPWTLEHLFKHLRDNETFDYIYWTGDLPAHNVWNQSRSDQLYLLQYLSTLFDKYLPNSIILPAIGNHESSPVNSFPPSYIKGDNSISWLYDVVKENWMRFLPQSNSTSYDSITRGAFYTALLHPGFRVISMNMNYCNPGNWWILLNMTDPTGELEWMVSVLQQAEDNDEKVHIIGHIPPSACVERWSWNYYKIVNRYESTITGQFFGHTHRDHFEVFYDEETITRPVSVGFIGPSVTTYSGLNPGYRIYTADGFYKNSTWGVLDHDTHILNISEAQITNQPRWYKEYSAKDSYNMSSLFPKDWDKLVDTFKTDDVAFNKFYKYYGKSGPFSEAPCDQYCRKNIICSLRIARSGSSELCRGIVQDSQLYIKPELKTPLC